MIISIITPTKNRKQMLERCINSILQQDCKSVEHVIVDNCSDDGTVSMLNQYILQYPERIKFISEPDDGPDGAANKGIAIATGEVISLLGSDDLLPNNTIGKVIDFFSNNNVDCVYGDCIFVDDDDNKIKIWKPGKPDLNKLVNKMMYIWIGSAFWKKDIIKTIGNYYLYANDKGVADYDFAIRILKNCNVVYLPQNLSCYRLRKIEPKSWLREDIIHHKLYLISRRYGGKLINGHYIRYIVWHTVGKIFQLVPFLATIANKYRYCK